MFVGAISTHSQLHLYASMLLGVTLLWPQIMYMSYMTHAGIPCCLRPSIPAS